MNDSITLGPILFNWPEKKKIDFYYKIADEANLNVVYLGEIVCQKRFVLWEKSYNKIIERLCEADKEVIISSLVLINKDEELKLIKEYAENTDFLIEANDVSVINVLKGKSYCLGPYINVYNERALEFYKNNGATHITFLPELPKSSIEILVNSQKLDTEILVFGRIPLSISARCAHARAYKKEKRNCKFVCEQDLNGLVVNTLDHQPFLAINGLQTMSYTYCNMLREISWLQELGVNRFRISPHNYDMVSVIDLYRKVLNKSMSGDEAQSMLTELMPTEKFSNGFFYKEAGCKLLKSSLL